MSVTRVPLQPVGKGTLTKLWIGVALSIAVAGGVAYATMPQVVSVTAIKAGDGDSPTATDTVLVNYKGMLENGKVFDEGQQRPIPLEVTVPGFSEGVQKMKKGGKYKLFIPAAMGYGAEAKIGPDGQEAIPANSDLVFEVELLDFISNEQFQAMQAQQQQMLQQQMQQQGGGAPGAAPQGAPGQ